jgi:hypothetical protein
MRFIGGLQRMRRIQGTGSLGYYSKADSLIAPSQFLIYPFVIVLASLVKEAKESQQLGEKIENTINRIKKASVGLERKR